MDQSDVPLAANERIADRLLDDDGPHGDESLQRVRSQTSTSYDADNDPTEQPFDRNISLSSNLSGSVKRADNHSPSSDNDEAAGGDELRIGPAALVCACECPNLSCRAGDGQHAQSQQSVLAPQYK